MRESARRLFQALAGSVGLLEAGISGVPRARGPWDAVVATRAPELPGDTLTFVALEDGTIVVDADIPDGSASPIADAVERELSPPYEAAAVRGDGDLWRVAAHRVIVVAAETVEGPECVELTRVGDETSAYVDAVEASPQAAPGELVGLLERYEGDVALTCERLDDATWVVERWEL